MKRLTLKTFRDLKAMRLRGLTIALLVACQCAVYSGGLCARLTLRETVDRFCRDHRLADLQVTFEPVPSRRLPSMDGIRGVAKTAGRLAIRGSIRLADSSALPAVVIFVKEGENPAIDTLQIEEGVFPTAQRPGVVVERGLRGSGFRVGDAITVSAYGFTLTRPIVGIARSPEFLVSTANPEMMIPIPGSLGIVYAPVELCGKELARIPRRFGGAEAVNQLLVLFGGAVPGPEGEILARLRGASVRVEEAIRRDRQFGLRFLEEDLKMFREMIAAIVGVFSVVTLVATAVSVTRATMSQRRELGALMALGCGRAAIAASCLRMGFLLGLAGALAGVAVSPAVNRLLASTYASAIGLPPVVPVFSARIMGEAVLLGVLVTCAAALVPAVALARMTPVQAMRGVGARAPWFAAVRLRAGSAIVRAARRNIIRRPALTATTVAMGALGVGLAAGFVVTLTSIVESSDALLRGAAWDVTADFVEPLSGKDAAALCGRAGLASFRPVAGGFVSLDAGAGPADYRLVGLPPGSERGALRFTAGRGFSGPDAGEVVLNAGFLSGAPPAIGARVDVAAGGRSHRLTVAGLVSSLSTGQAYVPIGTARRILGMGDDCSGFMASAGAADAAEARKKLYASDLVSRVTLKSELEAAIHGQLAKATRLITLAIVLGAVVALALLVNTASMNVLEREGEFATLMSLGYGRRPITMMVLAEVLATGLVSLALAPAVAAGIAWVMNASLSRVWFRIDTVVTARDLLISLLPPFIALPLAAAPALRHIFSLDIAAVVRRHVIE